MRTAPCPFLASGETPTASEGPGGSDTCIGRNTNRRVCTRRNAAARPRPGDGPPEMRVCTRGNAAARPWPADPDRRPRAAPGQPPGPPESKGWGSPRTRSIPWEGTAYHRGSMSDQLSLELPPESPALPTGLRPMEPRPLASPFDSADHLFQPLWGGLRALAFVTASRAPEPGAEGERPDVRRPGTTSVVLLDGDGQDRTANFPELADVAASLRAGTAVLDGEIVVVDRAGRLDPEQLAARLAGRGRAPAIFLAFDRNSSPLAWPAEAGPRRSSSPSTSSTSTGARSSGPPSIAVGSSSAATSPRAGPSSSFRPSRETAVPSTPP